MTELVRESDADGLIDRRIERLRALSWEEASQLPASVEEQVAVGGTPCALTTFRQAGVLKGRPSLLVTVQLARPRCFGAMGDHLEKGLVFAPGSPPRPATPAELRECSG